MKCLILTNLRGEKKQDHFICNVLFCPRLNDSQFYSLYSFVVSFTSSTWDSNKNKKQQVHLEANEIPKQEGQEELWRNQMKIV